VRLRIRVRRMRPCIISTQSGRAETPHVSCHHLCSYAMIVERCSKYHVRHHANPREAFVVKSIRSHRVLIASTRCVINAYIRPDLRISGWVSSNSSSLNSFDLGARYLKGFIDVE
jgi:hypothetical protein